MFLCLFGYVCFLVIHVCFSYLGKGTENFPLCGADVEIA